MEAPRLLNDASRLRLDEVTEELDRRHLDMLNAESVEERQEILRQLRGHIIEYLYLAAPRGKFKLVETARVLSQSVPIAEFDPRDAKEAFEDLAKYAHNLLEQPWRKEFHKISLVSGFFLHNIRAHLRDVQDLLVLLGYVSTDDHTMELHHVGHEEILRSFSRDCYVASHECLILSQIWERVQREVPNNPMTLLEAWNTRKAYTGDVDSACASLLIQARHRIYKREEAERELMKQKEYERFRLILAKAELAPAPEVPVDNTLVDLTEQNDGELARRVLENTEKKSYATKTRNKLPEMKSGLGGQPYLNQNAAQFHPSLSALNGAAQTSSHFSSSDSPTRPYDLVDGRGRDQTAELDEIIMQKFLNGQVPSGAYRPRTHKIHVHQQEENPYYSTVEGARPNEKQFKEREFGFQPLLDQSRQRETNENAAVQLTNGTEANKTEELEYSMLHDAQEMLGRGRVPFSKPIDCAQRQELAEPMDTSSPPASRQERESPPAANIPIASTSTAFKSLSRKQDLPKSTSSTESEKKPGEKLLSKGIQLLKGNKSPKGGKENSRSKKQDAYANASRNSRNIVLGDFPLDKTKIPNPDSPNAISSSLRKAFGDKELDETEKMFRRLELEEESCAGANNESVFDATISNSGSEGVRRKQEEWDCKFCTYKNEAPHKVCTICAKSKDLCPENLESKLSSSPPKSTSPSKKPSESVWKTVTGKKKASKTGSSGSGSKTPNESDWPALSSDDSTTNVVYDTAGRRATTTATAESRSAYFSSKAKNQQTSVAAAISDAAVDLDSKLICPQCTYFNEPWRASCEMCSTKF